MAKTRAKMPFLYQKLAESLKKFHEANEEYVLTRDELANRIAASFRISDEDMKKHVIGELNEYGKTKRVGRDRIRLV